ncbi:molybdopterin molybdotransferase MoeA [Alphaproteobacteria bacterium]|nr:molybdopterin molybdotransferase MoeA [Alphaproteobacteria bacterium]
MPKKELLSVDQAISAIMKKISLSKKEEKIKLSDSLGRILSKNVISKRNNPSKDTSAMDGFAINSMSKTNKFKIIGESSAGNPFKGKVGKNETVQIFTGAFLPNGTNTIIIQENVKNINSDIITNTALFKKNQNVRKKGVDIKLGKIVVKKNTLINSRIISSIAMSNNDRVYVKKKPVIGILSTGNEIVDVGKKIGKNQIPSGNNLMISSMVKVFGGVPKILSIAKDETKDIERILNRNLDCDFFVSSGGASVGKYDLLKSTLDKKNNTTNLHFWKIAMRPGKPLIFAKYKNIPFLGLPGNPVSAGVCSLIFLRASINKILGVNKFFPDLHIGILNGELKKNDQRLDFVRAYFDKNDKNKIIPFSKQDSSMINLFSKCECLILRKPYEKKALKDTKVNFIKFPDLI